MDIDQACVAALQLPMDWIRAAPGRQIQALRMDAHVSLRHLAQIAEISPATLCRIEIGADARLSTWAKLYTALGFAAVLAPLPVSEDAGAMIDDERGHRWQRMENGRQKRWL